MHKTTIYYSIQALLCKVRRIIAFTRIYVKIHELFSTHIHGLFTIKNLLKSKAVKSLTIYLIRCIITPHLISIIYLIFPKIQFNRFNKGAEGAMFPSRRDFSGGEAMVTYSDLFSFVIMICAVITLVVLVSKKHKK